MEQRMLDTLATKRTVAESVLDLEGSVQSVPLRSSRKAMVERVKGLVSTQAVSGRSSD